MNLKLLENFILCVSLILRKNNKTTYTCWHVSEAIAIKEEPACDLN